MEERKEQIKVGSKVVVGSGLSYFSIQTVDGETSTCWKVGKRSFYKKNGYSVHSDTHIRLATQGDYDRIEQRETVELLRGADYNSLSLATLRKIKELLAKGE